MPLTKFAMIIIGAGYDPAVHRAVLQSPAFSTTVVCVSHVSEAVKVAIELHQQGMQLIELCGGFTPDQAAQIACAVQGNIPIGVVRYSALEQQHLARLFAPANVQDA